MQYTGIRTFWILNYHHPPIFEVYVNNPQIHPQRSGYQAHVLLGSPFLRVMMPSVARVMVPTKYKPWFGLCKGFTHMTGNIPLLIEYGWMGFYHKESAFCLKLDFTLKLDDLETLTYQEHPRTGLSMLRLEIHREWGKTLVAFCSESKHERNQSSVGCDIKPGDMARFFHKGNHLLLLLLLLLLLHPLAPTPCDRGMSGGGGRRDLNSWREGQKVCQIQNDDGMS